MLSFNIAAVAALAAIAPGVIAACNRTALLEFADAYVFAHENGCLPLSSHQKWANL